MTTPGLRVLGAVLRKGRRAPPKSRSKIGKSDRMATGSSDRTRVMVSSSLAWSAAPWLVGAGLSRLGGGDRLFDLGVGVEARLAEDGRVALLLELEGQVA